MTMKSTVFFGVASIAAMAASAVAPAHASNDFAVGLGVGTAGAELQGSYRLNDRLAVRGGLNLFSLDRDETFDDIRYSGEVKFTSASALVDVRPFKNWATVTGGAIIGNREAKLTARPTTNTLIGNVSFTPAQIGQLNASIDLGDVAPYFGIGIDTTYSGSGSGFGFRASIGAAFGKADTSLTATGGTAPRPPELEAELAREAQRISEDADVLKTYPVISVGLTYRY